MNIDRPLVNLFFQIKRTMPLESRENMKISSPDIKQNLILAYKNSDDETLKSMIEDFLTRTSNDWKAQVNSNSKFRTIDAIVKRMQG